MAYIYNMEFVEGSAFHRWNLRTLSDDDFRELQNALALRPDRGVLIPGGGGLRKIRWSVKGKGKRGGARIIYYWVVVRHAIVLLLGYEKGRKADLSPAELRLLRNALTE